MSMKDRAEQAYRAHFNAWLDMRFEDRQSLRSEIERKHAVWKQAIDRHFDREKAAMAA